MNLNDLFALMGKVAPHNWLAIPLLASVGTFVSNLNGMLADPQFHAMLQGASSLEMIVIAGVMAVLKLQKPE